MLCGRYAEDTEDSIALAEAKKQPPWLGRPWVWRFNGAYCAFSATNVFSRSWLLVELANAMHTLDKVLKALPEGQRERAGLTYAKLQAEYVKWKALAEAGVAKPSMAGHRLMQEVGRGGHRALRLPNGTERDMHTTLSFTQHSHTRRRILTTDN
jgi:hypothetical protein